MNDIINWLVDKFGQDIAEYIMLGCLLLFGILMLMIRHVTIKLSNKYIHPKELTYVTDVTYTKIHAGDRKTVYKFTRRPIDVKVTKTEYEGNEAMASASVKCAKDYMDKIQNTVEKAGIKDWPSLELTSAPTDRTLFVAYGMVTYFMLNVQNQPASADVMFETIDRMVKELGL